MTSGCLQGLQIGSVQTRTNLILSPMSGVTDCAFRTMVRTVSGPSVGLLVSEFVAAEGMTRDNAKTLSMLRFKEAERPISIQIFGADVDRMIRAAVMVEQAGADIVDINCGCPAPKVVRRGGGAQLMRTPDQLRAILSGIRRAVSIPVTVKIRSGWNDEGLNALEIARMVEGEGAAMLACHGRTRVQLYSGEADWDLVGQIRNALTIPVAGSGDVTSPQDALARLEGGYADAIMIGRAVIDNPWVFAQIEELAGGRTAPVIDGSSKVAALALFRRELEETKPERAFRGRYRGLACRLVKGMPGGGAARRAIGSSVGIDAVDKIFSDFVLGRRSGVELMAHVA
ncbi:MAG: tRNA-dihydrouridine synthase B [Hyphomicrobiaceae bacterium]|jgi:tRNA-dihydrouridine synthase B